MTHGGDAGELAVKKLEGGEEPVPGKGHDAEVGQDIGKVAALKGKVDDNADQAAEGEGFDEVAGAVLKERYPGLEAGIDLGVFPEPVKHEFFGPVDFYGFDGPEKLLNLLVGSPVGPFEAVGGFFAYAGKYFKNRKIKETENESGDEGDGGVHQEEGNDQQDNGNEPGQGIEQGEEHSGGVLIDIPEHFFQENPGIMMKEKGVGLGSHLPDEPDAQPVGKALGIAVAHILGHEIDRIRKEEGEDGECAGSHKELTQLQRREEGEEKLTEPGIPDAFRVRGDRKERKDGSDPDDLEDALGEEQRKDEQQLLAPVGTAEEVDLAEQIERLPGEIYLNHRLDLAGVPASAGGMRNE